MKDTYLLHKHTSETITIETTLYYVDGVQVCLSWYGNDEHPREMCDFLLWRKFGSQPICGISLNGIDDDPKHPGLCVAPEHCPLKMKRIVSCK